MDAEAFRALLRTMEEGWNGGDAAKVAACFAEDVDYTDPLRYAFSSREELLPFFEPPPGGHSVHWHNVLFDEPQQAGAAEYTYQGHRRYHGAVLIRVAEGVVTEWREWQHVAEQDWDAFLAGAERAS